MTKAAHSPREGILFIIRFLSLMLLFVLLTLLFAQLFSLLGETHSPTLNTGLVPDTATDQRRLLVVLDAGHGGEDGGATGNSGVCEKDLNLSLALHLADLLRLSGVDVVLTREDDRLLYDPTADYKGRKKMLDLVARRKIAEEVENEYPANTVIFVSIHMNAFPSPDTKGLQVWFSGNDPSSERLAEAVQETVRRDLQPENHRQIKKAGSNIYLLDRLTLPSVLIECGFLSNPKECALLENPEYRKKLAFSLCASILTFHSSVS